MVRSIFFTDNIEMTHFKHTYTDIHLGTYNVICLFHYYTDPLIYNDKDSIVKPQVFKIKCIICNLMEKKCTNHEKL